jgi:hypothetical protein
MNESNRKSVNDVDAGWDDLSPKPPATTRSLAPPPDLDAIDDGWSDVTHSVPLASGIPLSQISGTVSLASTPPAEIDELDEGWGDAPDDEPLPHDKARPSATTEAVKVGKKARRKLERELRARQQKSKTERATTRKETRREAKIRHTAEAQAQAEAQRRQQAARKAAKRQAKKQDLPTKPSSNKRSVEHVSSQITSLPHVEKPTVTPGKALIQGWMLWAGLVVILIALAYFVSRR